MSIAWITTWPILVINALAAYRLTRLLTRDSLPPLPAMRQTLTDRLNRGRTSEHPVAYLVGCPWCLGFWVSVAVVLLESAVPAVWIWVATPMAFSAVVGHLAGRDHE